MEPPTEQIEAKPAPPAATDLEFLLRLREGIAVGIVRATITVFFAAAIAYMSVPNFLTSGVRPRVSRTRADMRSIGLALDAYRNDSGVYPPGAAYRGALPSCLTTPVAYITEFPVSPFPANRFSPKNIAQERYTFRNFAWIGMFGVGAVGLSLLALAWALFQFGKATSRYGMVLLLGCAGVFWTVLSLVTGTVVPSAAMDEGGFPDSGTVAMQLALTVATPLGLLAFGSGIRRAMQDAPWWSPPMILQALILAAWFGLCAGSYRISDTLAAIEVNHMTWEAPADEHFLYATDGKSGWVLWSGGPDGVNDLPGADLPRILHEPSKKGLWDVLLQHAYDPTNGTISRGDIWRVSQ